MEANLCLELLSGHDILTPESEPNIVRHFLKTLQEHKIISQSSLKDLQPILAATNICLNSNSAAGKLNGFLALNVLVEDCNSQLFTQVGPSWIQQVVLNIKPSNATAIFFTDCCSALSRIVKYAQENPDVSRHITAAATNLVTSLIDCAKANPSATNPIMTCIQSLQKHYFGAVGPVVRHLEKFLLENLHPWNRTISTVNLTKSFSLLPKAGGGGKDGIVHKEAWDTLALKTTNTLDHLAGLLLAIVPSLTSTNRPSEKAVLEIPRPRDSLDLLRKSYFYTSQFASLSKCFSALLLAPLSTTKSIRPSPVIKLATRVVKSLSLSSMATKQDLETRILFSVWPDVLAAILTLLRDLVKVCRADLLLFIPDILNLILALINDLRQSSNPATCIAPFSVVRIQLYELVFTMCSVLGPTSGVEYIAQALIPLTVSDFLPPKGGVKLVSAPKANAKQKNGARTSQNENLQQKSLEKDAVKLAVASLNCLAGIFKCSGSLLRTSVHKNVQCVLIGLCTEMQAEKGTSSTFASPDVRAATYSALLEVLVSCHTKWPAPIPFAIKIFQQGIGRKEENNGKVVQICQKAMVICELLAHPRSTTLDLELPMNGDEILSTKNESMKVHVVYIDNSGGGDSFAVHNLDDEHVEDEKNGQSESGNEEDDSAKVLSAPKRSGSDFSNQPGFDILSGKVKGGAKRKADTDSVTTGDQSKGVAEDVDFAECEKLLKDVNSFDNNKAAITIPDEVANRHVPDSATKKVRLEVEPADGDSTDGGVDLETMLSAFVDKPNEK